MYEFAGSTSSTSTSSSMIFIGRNPRPRYLVARRENKTTRWERRSKIFGSSKSVNCLVGNLMGIRFERSVKFANFVSAVSIFGIRVLEHYY